MPGPTRGLIRTFTGKEINPVALRPEDIDIRDIAHGLAHVNRFGGQTKFAINVAQHSVLAMRLVKFWDGTPEEQLQALLHDASEAYLGDVTKWVKALEIMHGYRLAEHAAMQAICKTFKIDAAMGELVDRADRLLVRFEGLHGFGPDFKIDHPNYPRLTEHELRLAPLSGWSPWASYYSKSVFLREFSLLAGISPVVHSA